LHRRRALRRLALALSVLMLWPAAAAAAVLTEDFEAGFPAWQSGWFGKATSARNGLCDDIFGPGTGDCTSGGGVLFLAPTSRDADRVVIDVRLKPGFDALGAQQVVLQAFDPCGALVHQQTMALCCCGQRVTVDFEASDGLARLRFVVLAASHGSVRTDDLHLARTVPDPASALLLPLGLPLPHRWRQAAGGARS
jgi:hypothetical protein